MIVRGLAKHRQPDHSYAGHPTQVVCSGQPCIPWHRLQSTPQFCSP